MKTTLVTIKVVVPEQAVTPLTSLVTMLGGEFEEIDRILDTDQSVPVPPLEKTVRPGRLLRAARIRFGKTQKELAERTGINQADISKLENGTRNPSVNLLKRLADGMGMAVKIEFVPKQKA